MLKWVCWEKRIKRNHLIWSCSIQGCNWFSQHTAGFSCSRKPTQDPPARLFRLPGTPQHSPASCKGTAGQKTTAARWRSCWWHLPDLNQVIPNTQVMIQPRVMGICSPKLSPGPVDISAAHWAGLGNDRNYEISAGQDENGSILNFLIKSTWSTFIASTTPY